MTYLDLIDMAKNVEAELEIEQIAFCRAVNILVPQFTFRVVREEAISLTPASIAVLSTAHWVTGDPREIALMLGLDNLDVESIASFLLARGLISIQQGEKRIFRVTPPGVAAEGSERLTRRRTTTAMAYWNPLGREWSAHGNEWDTKIPGGVTIALAESSTPPQPADLMADDRDALMPISRVISSMRTPAGDRVLNALLTGMATQYADADEIRSAVIRPLHTLDEEVLGAIEASGAVAGLDGDRWISLKAQAPRNSLLSPPSQLACLRDALDDPQSPGVAVYSRYVMFEYLEELLSTLPNRLSDCYVTFRDVHPKSGGSPSDVLKILSSHGIEGAHRPGTDRKEAGVVACREKWGFICKNGAGPFAYLASDSGEPFLDERAVFLKNTGNIEAVWASIRKMFDDT